MLTIGRERAAFAAYQTLQGMGAQVAPVHHLPNGMGYFRADTGKVHGPACPACRGKGHIRSLRPYGELDSHSSYLVTCPRCSGLDR